MKSHEGPATRDFGQILSFEMRSSRLSFQMRTSRLKWDVLISSERREVLVGGWEVPSRFMQIAKQLFTFDSPENYPPDENFSSLAWNENISFQMRGSRQIHANSNTTIYTWCLIYTSLLCSLRIKYRQI